MTFSFSTLLPVAGNLLGGLMGDSAAKKQAKQQQAFAREQFEWQKNRITNTVADAKNAGIHPLFALGSSANISPVSMSGGGGSALGEGVSRAGELLGAASAQGKKPSGDPMEQQLVEARIAREKAGAASDLASANYYNSMAAKTEREGRAISTARDIATLGNLNTPGRPAAPPASYSPPRPKGITTLSGRRPRVGQASDAEDVEQRYGEVASELQGLGNMINEITIPWLRDQMYDIFVPIEKALRKRPRPRRKPFIGPLTIR